MNPSRVTYVFLFINLNDISSIHGVFLRNRLYLGHTGVTSFCMQFKKVGRGLLREAKPREGEWVVLSKAKGGKKKLAALHLFLLLLVLLCSPLFSRTDTILCYKLSTITISLTTVTTLLAINLG